MTTAPPAHPTTPLLALHGVTLHTRHRSIGPFALEVHPGELVALLGPNGSGKTTLLRLALGLEPASEGTVAVAGAPVGPTRPPRRVGAVLEPDGLLPWRTGRQNLQLVAGVVGADPTEVEARLVGVGLGDAADAAVRAYSRGMRQRLAIARALLGSPPLLVLDEPTVALDAEAADWLAALLVEHVADGGGAVVATHDRAWLGSRAHREVHVRNGTTHEVATDEVR